MIPRNVIPSFTIGTKESRQARRPVAGNLPLLAGLGIYEDQPQDGAGTGLPNYGGSMASKRLKKELEQYAKDPSSAIIRLDTVGDDLTLLSADLRGPEGTGYEGTLTPPAVIYDALIVELGGVWTLSISVLPTYPNTPPEIHFKTPICHANVSFTTGEICLDLLKTSWTPAYGIVSTLEAVQQLLNAGGEPDSPLNLDIAVLLREGDLVAAESLVRFYTKLYAMR
ncbi:hypothetical protein LTR53_009190 [Teratosphaeriaceae sp. CCFEE 6253]|nr:hypothetical protein LTR53_009190 [Teratosphaeriaceae sp. CCFEE 6253]